MNELELFYERKLTKEGKEYYVFYVDFNGVKLYLKPTDSTVYRIIVSFLERN